MADGTEHVIELVPGQTYEFDDGVLAAIERDYPGALAAPAPARAVAAPEVNRQVTAPAATRAVKPKAD